MNFEGYVDRVDFHLDRLGVDSQPSQSAYIDAWNNQIPARKMAESYQRRLHKSQELKDDPNSQPAPGSGRESAETKSLAAQRDKQRQVRGDQG